MYMGLETGPIILLTPVSKIQLRLLHGLEVPTPSWLSLSDEISPLFSYCFYWTHLPLLSWRGLHPQELQRPLRHLPPLQPRAPPSSWLRSCSIWGKPWNFVFTVITIILTLRTDLVYLVKRLPAQQATWTKGPSLPRDSPAPTAITMPTDLTSRVHAPKYPLIMNPLRMVFTCRKEIQYSTVHCYPNIHSEHRR